MIVEGHGLFSDAQAVTADAVGTNVLDQSSDRSIGNGEPMAVVFTVDVAADLASGNETYVFEVEYASNSAQTTGRQLIGRRSFEAGTPTAPNQNANLLVAGFSFSIPIPPTKLSESERFLGIRYDVGGTTPAITVTALLQPLSMVQAENTYPKGYTIS